jgi:hypothetical protein
MILVGLIYALSIVPVQWRNHQNYHVFTLTLIDRVTLHRYLRNAVVSSIDYVDPSENLKKQDSLDQLQLPDLERIPDARAHVAYYHQQWQSIWMEHKGVIAQVYLQNLFSNTHTGNTFLQTSVSSKTKEAVFNLTRIWNMLFVGLLVFFLPLLIFLTRKHRKFLLLAYLFYGLALYLFLTSGISFWQGDRLHSLLFPFVAISLLFFLSICVENKWRFIGAEKKDE